MGDTPQDPGSDLTPEAARKRKRFWIKWIVVNAVALVNQPMSPSAGLCSSCPIMLVRNVIAWG